MNEKRNILQEINAYYGKVPPQATEVEEAVLAGLMLDNDSFGKISSILKSDYFYKESNRIIFDTIASLVTQSKPYDLIMVTQELKTNNQLDEVGGVFGLTTISRNVVLSSHIEHHARIVAQKYFQRKLILIGTETVQNGFDDTIEFDEQLHQLRTKIEEIENVSISSNGGRSQFDVLTSAIVEMEKDCENVANGRPPGIGTGLSLLNKHTGGWRDTNLIIIAARPGIGKTSLALHFTKVASKMGTFVNFYGLEMTSEDLMRIIISGESDVNRSSIRDGRLEESDWDSINESSSRIEKLPVMWYDVSGITTNQIAVNTRHNVKRGQCGLVVIDYLQLLNPNDKKVNREQQISDMTRTLKRTALENKVPIILLSQLNREASEGKPQLHHLRESGAIEQDADIVIFPWKEDEKYQLTIAKNRRGVTGTFEIQVNEEMTHFDNFHPDFVYPVPKNNSNSRIEPDSPF
jgi:replicative DNA helicase